MRVAESTAGAPPGMPSSVIGLSVEDSLATMGVKLVALVISNTNYTRNHLRALKGFKPEQRADSVADTLKVP